MQALTECVAQPRITPMLGGFAVSVMGFDRVIPGLGPAAHQAIGGILAESLLAGRPLVMPFTLSPVQINWAEATDLACTGISGVAGAYIGNMPQLSPIRNLLR